MRKRLITPESDVFSRYALICINVMKATFFTTCADILASKGRERDRGSFFCDSVGRKMREKERKGKKYEERKQNQSKNEGKPKEKR